VVRRVFLLHQQTEIEPGCAAADANDAHIFFSVRTARNFTSRIWLFGQALTPIGGNRHKEKWPRAGR